MMGSLSNLLGWVNIGTGKIATIAYSIRYRQINRVLLFKKSNCSRKCIFEQDSVTFLFIIRFGRFWYFMGFIPKYKITIGLQMWKSKNGVNWRTLISIYQYFFLISHDPDYETLAERRKKLTCIWFVMSGSEVNSITPKYVVVWESLSDV